MVDTREEMVRQLRAVGEYILKNADQLMGPDRYSDGSIFTLEVEMFDEGCGRISTEVSTTSRYKI